MLLSKNTHKSPAVIMIGLSVIIGGTSLPAFGLFLLLGPLFNQHADMPLAWALLVDTFLSLVFFLQHSIMVRNFFRTRLEQRVHNAYAGAIYAIASGIFIWCLLFFWQPSEIMIYSAEGLIRWTMRGVFLLAVAGFIWTNQALGYFDSLGIRSILYKTTGKTPPRNTFIVRGPYRRVRHPFYLLSLMMIWSFPDITLDRLLFNTLWTVWIIIGTLLEERDMIATHGASYHAYRREVPMLIPRCGKKAVPEN